MNSAQRQLKFAYWNIQGLNASKLEDSRLADKIGKHDLICIAETHYDNSQNINVPGYKCFKVCRVKNKKINRCFGGLAILYKNELQGGVKFLEHKNNDYVWVKLCKVFFGTNKDNYLCAAYIPPENSSYNKIRNEETLDMIENDMVKYSDYGYVTLLGDLNARTGVENDYIKNDCVMHEQENEFYFPDIEIIPRFSQDVKQVCTRGKRLLELCTTAQLRILNGRIIGDSIGKFTCDKYGGSSVVDYVITSESNV